MQGGDCFSYKSANRSLEEIVYMKKVSGINYFNLAALAFASIGLEVLLVFGIEPVIYGSSINEWTDLQNNPLGDYMYPMGHCRLVHHTFCKKEIGF